MLTVLLCAAATTASAAWDPPRSARRPYSEALVALGTGRVEDAEDLLREILRDTPDCGMCQQGLGVAVLRQGRVDEARRILSSASEGWPDHAETWASLSAAAFVGQDFVAARDAAARGVDVDSGSLDAQAALQQALLRLGDLDAAEVALDGSRPHLPEPVVACFEVQLTQERGRAPTAALLDACRRAGTPDLVAGALSRSGGGDAAVGAMAARLGLDPVLLVAQALDLAGEGDAAGALGLLDGLLEGWPHRVDARALRAQLRRASGDDAGALADLEALLEARSWVDVHRTGGMSGILTRSDERRLAGTIAEAAALLVDLHVEAGRLDAAASRYADARSLSLHPAILAAGTRLALARGDVGAAWALVLEGIEAFPTDPRPVAVAGAVALADPRQLPAWARKALAASGDWRDRYNLALVLKERGEAAACGEQAEVALNGEGLSPADRQRLSLLAHGCAVDSGDVARADAALGRLGSAAEASPVALYNHALLHLNAGDAPAATRVLGDLPERLSAARDAQPGVTAAVVALGLRARYGGADPEGAAALAQDPAATDADRVWLAGRLAGDGDLGAARAVLPRDCAALEEPLAGRCAIVAAQVGRR